MNIHDKHLVINLIERSGTEHKVENINCILDIDLFKNIHGIEVIGLKDETGMIGVTSSSPGNGFEISYDDEGNALYIKTVSQIPNLDKKIQTSSLLDQVSVFGTIFLNNKNLLVGLEFDL